jgi:exosortase/archaeosortase family protein
VHGRHLTGRFSLEIVKNCDAMEVNILFVSAVLAFPEKAWKRLVGIVCGLPILVLLNVLRICALYFIGVHAFALFETFHLELFPLVLVAAAGAIFVGWASWARGARAPGTVPSAAS